MFLKPQAYLHTKNIVGKVPPPLDFFADGMYVRDPLLAYVDETVFDFSRDTWLAASLSDDFFL